MQISVPPLPTSTTAQPLIDITGHNISDCVQLLLEPQNASYSFLFPYVVVLRRQGLRHLYCKHLNVGNWWSYCCETWPYLKRPFLQQYVIFWLTSWVVVPLEVIMPLPFDWVHYSSMWTSSTFFLFVLVLQSLFDRWSHPEELKQPVLIKFQHIVVFSHVCAFKQKQLFMHHL